MRQTGDYGDFIIFEEGKVVALLQPARELILQIEAIILSIGDTN